MAKLGDQGLSLVGGKRLSKTNPLFQALGDLDELNCFLGLVKTKTRDEKIIFLLEQTQKDLIEIGGVLTGYRPSFSAKKISYLEDKEKEFSGALKPLKNFVLPGRSERSVLFHLARAVCRRSERSVFSLGKKIPQGITGYLNRLSTLLFVLSRS